MAFSVAQSNPNADTPTDLYTVPTARQAVISTLAVSETNGLPATYSILVRPAGAAASTEHTLVAKAELVAFDSQFFTIGIALAQDDVVTVEASTGDVAFSAFINETPGV